MNIYSFNGVQSFFASDYPELRTDKLPKKKLFNSNIENQKQYINSQTIFTNYLMPKFSLSFNGSNLYTRKKHLSNEEFEKLKIQFYKKAEALKYNDDKQIVKLWNLNKNNINLALKILDRNNSFKQNEWFLYKISKSNILTSAKTKEKEDILIKLLDKSDSVLANETFLDYFKSLISISETKEGNEIISKMIDLDEEVLLNEIFMDYVSNLFVYAKTNCQQNVIKKILDKSDKLLTNETFMDNIWEINSLAKTELQSDVLMKILDTSDENLSDKIFIYNAKYLLYNIKTKEQAETGIKILDKDYDIQDFIEQVYKTVCKFKAEETNNLNLEIFKDFQKAEEKIELHRQQIKKNPHLYINGDVKSETETLNDINTFFADNYPSLIILCSIFDNKTINTLLRERFFNVEEYLKTISSFNLYNLLILSLLIKSNNQNGVPFSEKQKIDFINLISAYKEYELSTIKMHKMANIGLVDEKELNSDLFFKILKKCGLTQEEIFQIPEEKMTSWDIKYMHLLSKEIDKNPVLSEIIRVVNLGEFQNFIHDTSNKYGKVNANTKALFEENNMDYYAWLNPNKENNVLFVSKNEKEEQLKLKSDEIKEDIDKLISTPAGDYIKKHLPGCIKDNKFVIPNKCLTNKNEFSLFMKDVVMQLKPVFDRAQSNINNPYNRITAQNTLTIQNDLNQKIDDISKFDDIKKTKEMNVTIKMWDRKPQKDLFQGNYSTCCIKMGGLASIAMPHYLLNSAFNMIELVDNTTGKTIGNSLCYFVKNENGEPVFILDNIEINKSHKVSDETGIDLRNAIVEYASNVVKEVTGRDNIKIYMSSKYNDVPITDLKTSEQQISLIGDIDCDKIYLDLYNGWTGKYELSNNQKLLKLS